SQEELPLDALSAPGVYGMLADLALDEPIEAAPGDPEAGTGIGPTNTLSARTTVVWQGSTLGQPAQLAVIVPLMLPESVRSMPNRAALGEAAPRLDALLTAAETWQATVAIDPRIVAGI